MRGLSEQQRQDLLRAVRDGRIDPDRPDFYQPDAYIVDQHLMPVVERIVAARVDEVVERVEALADEWEHPAEVYALRKSAAPRLRAALRAADPHPHDTDRHDQPKEPDHMSECPNAGACTRPADCPFCWPPTESEEA